MRELLETLIREHAAIEAAIERFFAQVKEGEIDAALFRAVSEAAGRHYAGEERFLAELAKHEPALAAKLKAQHDEALEIAARLEESLAAGQRNDALYLARRFVAIASHNIIEEERDVFPLARRVFPSAGSG